MSHCEAPRVPERAIYGHNATSVLSSGGGDIAVTIKIVDDPLFAYLTERISGARFEVFAKLVFSHVYGEKFLPLGGMHDGGADGLLSSYIQEVEGKTSTFIQFSVTAEGRVKRKITDTLDALKKVGRNPRQLFYATTQSVPKADVIAQEVFDDYSVHVAIRDAELLKKYLNTNEPANSTFYEFFVGELLSLSRAAETGLASVNTHANDPTVYVFLNHELKDRFSKSQIQDRVVDALVNWVLRDTDPERGQFLSRLQIVAAIEAAFPMARSVLVPRVDARLAELTKKLRGEARLRHHQEKGLYCLPYELRRTLASESSACIQRQQEFKKSVCERVRGALNEELSDELLELSTELVFQTVHKTFVEQGLILSAFLKGQLDALNLSDQVVEDLLLEVVTDLSAGDRANPKILQGCLSALRGVFYHCTESEHAYLEYLCRTSCLLVTMQSAPRLLEYLNRMGGNFRLLVGSDLLVKAISERYLEPEHQQVSNLLKISKQLGSELILTEPTLMEVFTHLHATDLEFRNHYEAQEQYLGAAEVSECDRIMIRAYFYAKRTRGGPKSWPEFVNQLTDPAGLRAKSATARMALMGVLQQRFRMLYLSTDELEKSVPTERVKALAERLGESRATHEELNYNDALMVYATYSQRRRHEESAAYDGFGFRTWWLTKETHILSLTADVVRAEGAVPYIMRPEFLLNFVVLAPSAADARKAFAQLLPTTAGLQLGQHLPAEVMHGLLKEANEWSRLTPERVGTIMSTQVNRLKHDRMKRYLESVGGAATGRPH